MEMRRRRKVFVGEGCLWENNRQFSAECGLYCRRERTIANLLLNVVCIVDVGEQ